MLDVGVESWLVAEVEVVGGNPEAVTARLIDISTVGRAQTQLLVFSEGYAEYLFDVLICPLGLAIGLWIVSTRVAAFDVEEFAELTPDF